MEGQTAGRRRVSERGWVGKDSCEERVSEWKDRQLKGGEWGWVA